MHQHDKTNQIVLEIFKLITLKKGISFKKVKKLFIQGDPIITKLFWDFLRQILNRSATVFCCIFKFLGNVETQQRRLPHGPVYSVIHEGSMFN